MKGRVNMKEAMIWHVEDDADLVGFCGYMPVAG